MNTRRILIAGGVAAVIVGAGVAFGVQYQRAGARMEHHRRALRLAEAELTAVQTTLLRVQAGTELSERAVGGTRTEISHAVNARAWMAALTDATAGELTKTQAAITDVDTARWLVGANAGVARSCFDGVSRAVAANRSGDGAGSVAALSGANEPCARTLAFATGARFPYDFADPYILRAGGTYYGYSTNSGAGDVQVIRSSDLVTWELTGNALPALPGWARPGTTWAPAVLARGHSYILYYTTREIASNRQCISRAVASHPTGPFLDDSSGPLVCDPGGSIDPSPFVDADGRAFLVWKSEAVPAAPTIIWSQPLTGDGRAVTGTASQLVAPDLPFERGVVEAPSLFREGGRYYLLYSAANWTSSTYSTAFATCAGPAGPCTKPVDNRVLATGPRLAGPGGAEIFHDGNGSPLVAFHAFSVPHVGYPSSRYLHIAPLRVNGDDLAIEAST